MKFCNLIIILFFFTVSKNLIAQDKILGTETVTSEQEYEATITNSQKISDLPSFKDSIPPAPKLSYNIVSKFFYQEFFPTAIAPATIKGEPLSKLYRSFIKLGYGNYNTPYADYFYNNIRSKTLSYGVHYNFMSTSGSFRYNEYDFKLRDHTAGAHLKYLFKEYTLRNSINYNNNYLRNTFVSSNLLLNFLPITVPNNIISQVYRYNRWSVNNNLSSNFEDPTKHYNSNSNLAYSGIANIFITEHALSLNTEIGKNYEKEYIHVKAGVDFYSNKNADIIENNFFVNINPKLYFKNELWLFDVGAKITPVFSAKNKVYFYPDVHVAYNIFKSYITVFTKLSGGAYRNTFNSLTQVNPFISSASTLQNTNNQYTATIGLTGHFTKNINYQLKVSHTQYSNYAFFADRRGQDLRSDFNVIYDDFSQTQFTGSLEYKQSEKLLIGIAPTFNINKALTLAKAFYTPAFILNSYAKYNLADKFIAKLDLDIINGMYAETNALFGANLFTVVKLKTIASINLGIEYKYNKRLGAFLQFNNLGFQQAYRFVNYRLQSFNILGGISYSF